MSTVNDLDVTLARKCDQLNFEDVQNKRIIVEIKEVRIFKGTQQPIFIDLVGYEGRPYKPCLTMRRVLSDEILGWGASSRNFIGRTLELYGDPTVKFGKDKPGGIRVGGMSGINADFNMMVTISRGFRQNHFVKKLPDGARELADKARLLNFEAITKEQEATIIALAKEAGTDLAIICKSAGVASIEHIAADKYDLIANKLDAKIKAAQQ